MLPPKLHIVLGYPRHKRQQTQVTWDRVVTVQTSADQQPNGFGEAGPQQTPTDLVLYGATGLGCEQVTFALPRLPIEGAVTSAAPWVCLRIRGDAIGT